MKTNLICLEKVIHPPCLLVGAHDHFYPDAPVARQSKTHVWQLVYAMLLRLESGISTPILVNVKDISSSMINISVTVEGADKKVNVRNVRKDESLQLNSNS